MFECLTCFFDGWFVVYLVCFHHMCFPKNLVSICLTLLNRSLIHLDTSLFYWSFFSFSRYLSIDSTIHRAIFLNSLFTWWISWHLLNRSKFLAVDTFRSIETLFTILYRYLSIYWDAWFYIYSRFDPIHFSFKYFDLSLFSLDPNITFSQKSFFSLSFQPLPSLNPLVSGLNLFFFSFFMHFRPRFWVSGNFLGFLCFW